MNISIDNYGNLLSSYDHDLDTITLGYEFIYAENILLNKDFSVFISDIIAHELIHDILWKEFNITISKLFDAVEHFIGDINIKEQIFNEIRTNIGSDLPETWHDCIIKEGFNVFLQDYHIDNNDLIQAYIIAGGK